MEKVALKFIKYYVPLILANVIPCVNIFAQITVPSTTKSTSIECEVVIDIYHGLKDWQDGISYSGGQKLSSGGKKTKGAVTVANLNDTDNDGSPDNEDNSVKKSDHGRNEVDLIKIVIRKKNPSIPLSGTGDILLSVPSNVKLWEKPTKETLIANVSSTLSIPSSSLASSDLTYYAEAISASDKVRDMKFEIQFNGGMDYALATAIWAKIDDSDIWYSNSSTPIPGPNGTLTNADADNFYRTINETWISNDGTRHGFGTFYSGQPIFENSVPHPLTPLLPVPLDKQIGGRILFQFTIKPDDSEEELSKLAYFDCTRQKKGKLFFIEDFITEPFGNPIVPFPFELVGGDVETANDDKNNSSDEDSEPKNFQVYSADIPSNYLIEKDNPTYGFKINQINFNEFVRLKIKADNGPFPFNGNSLIGSRCSKSTKWSCFYYLRRGTLDKRYVIDNNVASTSEPNKSTFFSGNGLAYVVTASSATTAAYTLMYSADDSWILLDEIGVGPSAVYRNSGSNSWEINYGGLTINIFEGSVPFSENDTFYFNTFNSLKKKNTIGLGHLNIEISNP